MALTLDATLATAQNSASRHPLVEILSANAAPDIPFDGTTFTNSSENEFQPFILNHSNGTTILAYLTDKVMFSYTDAEGIQFTTVELTTTYNNPYGVSFCEMPNGNIGLLVITAVSTLEYFILTPQGVQVSHDTIATITGVISHTWVVYDSVGAKYIAYYAKKVGSAYNIFKRTSTNFTSWTADSAITFTGLLASQKISSPSVIKMDNGDWWMLFDYVSTISGTVEIANIYYSVSSNQGTTWGAPVALTSNTSINYTNLHPVGVQLTPTDLLVAYTKQQAILFLELLNSTDVKVILNIDINEVTGKLYIWTKNVLNMTGIDYKLIEVDIDTWTVTNHWDKDSIPSLNAGVNEAVGTVSPYMCYGSSKYHPVISFDIMSILNSDTGDIKTYCFVADVTYGTTVNMVYAGDNPYVDGSNNPRVKIRGSKIDEVNNRLWLFLMTDVSLVNYIHIGYIDLNEAGPTFTFNIVIKTTTAVEALESTGNVIFDIDFNEGLIFVGGKYWNAGYPGRLVIYTTAGALYQTYLGGAATSFPWKGISDTGFYYELGFAYFGFEYEANNGNGNRRGLCRLELATGICTYYQPPMISVDWYDFVSIVKGKGNTIIISSGVYGIFIFDTVELTWELRNKDAIPQMLHDKIMKIVYSPLDEMIYGAYYESSGSNDIFGMPLEGTLNTSQYMTAVLAGQSWPFIDQGNLLQGHNDYDAMVTMNPNNADMMVVFWENRVGADELNLKWDTALPSFDLAPYLVVDNEITLTRDIMNNPNSIEFTCSHGHLFDIHNKSSLFSNLLRKGRMIAVKWGERVNGLDYWHNAGTFFVVEASVSYEKGVYSDITIVAEDARRIWGDKQVYATDIYNAYPEAVLSDILQQTVNIPAGSINIPAMVNRVVLEHQWIDSTVEDIVNQICDRFGYFGKMDVDNNFTVVRISDKAATNHVYSNTNSIIKFKPDDRYSNFTNRVTVQGQSRNFIDVTYAEELVGTISGTVGWWGAETDHKILYSNDESRRCISPRLNILETTTSIGFSLAGEIEEYISYVDVNHKYCIVRIDAPDLTPQLIAAIAFLIGTLYLPDATIGIGGGSTIRIGSAATGIAAMAVMTILASIGNYQFEVYAQPTGSVRQSVQATANDTLHQTDINNIVENKLEDPLCYSSTDCQVVADFELMVVRLQRNRVTIEKIAHLQDEEGDVIEIPHPYSGVAMRVLIVKLRRVYKKSRTISNDGYFLDIIEGWVL